MSPPLHPSGLLDNLRRDFETRRIAGQRVLIAVSGGADSTALLRGALDLAPEFRLTICAAHLNHGLRGAASAADAAWVAQTCTALGVRLVAGTIDLSGPAQEPTAGIEETARAARYRFLEQAARADQCAAIATAHTADDQAETILHHILRGTGLAGLGGIPRERALGSGVVVIRPLLETTRFNVLGYLNDLGQPFRDDASNGDESFTRNRIRHTLLPQLAAEYNGQVADALRRLGRQAADAQAALEALAREALARALVRQSPDECVFDRAALSEPPRHLLRELFARLWQLQSWPRQGMGFDQWNQVAEIALRGGAADLPGRIEARASGARLVIVRTHR